MRNKFVHYSSINICALGFDKFLESIFCLLLVVESFSLQKAVEILEEVVISWREVRWIWQMKQNFVTQFVQLLKCWLYNVQLGVVMKNWNHSFDQCQLQALQFSVHLTDLLSILLRCNVFAEIQKAVVDQTGSRPPNSDHDLFLVQVWLWEVLWSLLFGPTTEPVVNGCHTKSTFYRTSQSDWEMARCCCVE